MTVGKLSGKPGMDPRPTSLRGRAKREGKTVWQIRLERQQGRHLVMTFAGAFPDPNPICPHCARDLDRREYPALDQTYLDCPRCAITWSIGDVPR